VAAGLRASRPGMEVQINPPGRRKVSDMIWLVAEPLLESAPNFELKQMILNLTALAWNFTLLEWKSALMVRMESRPLAAT
jgi:hypothetical protein